MFEELLRNDNLSVVLLKNILIYDIKNLMVTCKIFHKLIYFNEIWENKLIELNYENQTTKNSDKKIIRIYDLIDIDIPCNFFKEFMELFDIYSRISKKRNFYLLIDSFSYSANNKLLLTRVEKSYILQSKDTDWEYKIDPHKLDINKDGSYFIDLPFSLMIDNDLLIKLQCRLTIDYIENIYKYEIFDNSESIPIILNFLDIPDGIKMDIYLYKQYMISNTFDFIVDDNINNYHIYKIQFPYISINKSVLHNLIFTMNMKSKILQFKYTI